MAPHGGHPVSASADRSTVSTTRVWLLAALVGVALWAALASLPLDPTAGGGIPLPPVAAVLCTALAVFGLRSIPLRWVVRGMSLASGMLLGRFGELGALEGVTGSWKVLLWIGATAAALALAPSSRAVGGAGGIAMRAEDVPAPTSDHRHDAGNTADRRAPTGGGRIPVALLVAAVALVAATSLLVGPRAGQAFPVGARLGDEIDVSDARGDNALVARDRLDMTTRPRLTQEVVMTVRSPIASFWRTETFDLWDGSAWSRSEQGATLLAGGRVRPAADDLAARRGTESRQEFRLEIGYATAVPTAPSAVEVEAPVQLAQRPDGTVASPIDPLGSGTAYTVTSRQLPTDDATLASVADEPVPQEVLDRYAAEPVATDRVRDLAAEITRGADSDIERIRAIEGWLDRNTEYSLDAPLSPGGVDVVDHFLFDTRLGWCEQIASSLVVLARLSGVPARLATGFTQGEWDPVGRRYVVREVNAHAWAEVWFPSTGWVTFDPTAAVPQAGTAEATAGAAARDWREISGVALLLVAGFALGSDGIRRRWRVRRASRELVRARRALADRWDVVAEDQIEARGREAGVDRAPGDALPAYASAVATAIGDPQLVDTADRVERFRYGTGGEPGSPGN